MPDVVSPPETKVVSKSKASAANQGLKRKRAPMKPKSNPTALATDMPYVSAFAIGDLISHLQFGDGTVVAIDDAKLTIEFASRGTKQIIDDYVKRGKEGQLSPSDGQSGHLVGQQH